uniref:Integral membrane protein n=1 Tax=Streptomyces sp. NBC_00003 TaxID=2903608 RepID=A0AAU2UZB3_9ACTN
MRTVMGAAGLALMAFGGLLLWDQTTHWDVLIWLAGAVVLHDAVIAPFVLGVGLLLGGLKNRGLVRATLMTAGCLTLVALPVLLRPLPTANSSVLPLDYVRGLLISLATVAVLAVLLGAGRWAWGRAGKADDPEG